MAEEHGDQLPAGQVTDDTPLGQVRSWLRLQAEKGETCPCCKQRVQVYKRKLNKTMVRTLALLAIKQNKMTEAGYIHAPTVLKAHAGYAREVGKLAYWGFVEEGPSRTGDGRHAGLWRVTEEGYAFLRGQYRVARYVKLYNGKRLGKEGPWVHISEVAVEFDLVELLRGI
jgi:hypothetical protein